MLLQTPKATEAQDANVHSKSYPSELQNWKSASSFLDSSVTAQMCWMMMWLCLNFLTTRFTTLFFPSLRCFLFQQTACAALL